MDRKDEIIRLQMDVIQQMTRSNLSRIADDLWGTPAPAAAKETEQPAQAEKPKQEQKPKQPKQAKPQPKQEQKPKAEGEAADKPHKPRRRPNHRYHKPKSAQGGVNKE